MKQKIKSRIKYLLKKTPFYAVYKLKKDQKHFNFLKQEKVKFIANLKDQQERKFDFSNSDLNVINLNVNDICNSKCVMCNIWKRKKENEITPEQLHHILKDELFNNVKHIGITGGEPTLREDYLAIATQILETLPNIEGISSITNCIKHDVVIARVSDVIALCKRYNKSFSLMLSLDGVDSVHNKIRGVENNFKSTMKVYEALKNKTTIVFGCTISKDNVWDVDELLTFFQENKLTARFRVAEFIKRLYNDENTEAIRNFTADEKYHLILFFYKLIHKYEKDEAVIRTYQSIINILNGGERTIGCPYHKNGIVLSARGELAYCAPKSEIIGNALTEKASTLYQNNLTEKKRILKTDCSNCIHDYHAPITYPEQLKLDKDEYWKQYLKIESSISFNEHEQVSPIKNKQHQVFITGWYGTETVGDKAILAAIIDELYQLHTPNISIIITSIYPIVTQKTMRELNIKAKVIDAYSKEFVAYAKGADTVIMGGGPLMDLEELALPLFAFKLSKLNPKNTTIVYGCGLGPLTFERFINSVKEILNLSDTIKLRDQESVDLAIKWLDNNNSVELSGDPAKKYLQKITLNNKNKAKENKLSCYLREWTYEYSRNISETEFEQLKLKFELAIANYIKHQSELLVVNEICFEHMHNFVIGNDDRDFSRYFIKKYFSDYNIKVNYNKQLSTVDSIANNMVLSKYNIAMRFHSVVFAHTLNTPFTAIDYTRGGKISNYIADNSIPENLLSVEQIIEDYA